VFPRADAARLEPDVPEVERRMVNRTDDDDRSAVVTLSHAILEAIVRHDSTALATYLSRDFLLMGAEGRHDRAAFLEGVGSATFEARSFGFEWIDVQILGATAVAAGVQRVDVVSGGRDVTSRSAFTDVFVRESGGWRLGAAHSVDLPAVEA
jgi:ketosteroid isomerase-like protein